MASRKPKVAVFFGGESHSRDLSMETGYWICQYLPRNSFDIIPVHVQADGRWQVPVGSLPSQGPVQRMMTMLFKNLGSLTPLQGWQRLLSRPVEAVWSLIRGRGGDDGSLQAAGQTLGIKTVGSSAAACVPAANKKLFAACVSDIAPTPATLHIPVAWEAEEAVEKIRQRFIPPLFIKPLDQEGSAGVEEITDNGGLTAVIGRGQRFGDRLIQERARGTEMSFTLWQDGHSKLLSLPPTVIVPRAARFYDHLAKRRPGRVTLHTPDAQGNGILKQAEQIARDVYERLNLKGAAAIDLMADDGGVTLLEVNTVPMMTAATPLKWQLKAGQLHPAHFFGNLIRQSLD